MNINKLLFLISIIFTGFIFCAEQKKQNGLNNQLIEATKKGNQKSVEELLTQGDDVNAKDKYGDTALILATQKGHTQIVELLLDKNADVNAKNDSDNTALIYAACNGHTQIVELLLNKGADVNAENLADNTALMLAARYDHTQIVNLINSYQNEYLPHLTQNSREYEYQTLSDIADQTRSPKELAQLINEYAQCKLTFSEFLIKKQLPYYEHSQDVAVSSCSIQ